MNELVFKGQNNKVVTTSLKIAEVFGKEHQHILRDIRELIDGVSKIGDTPMFEETTYIHPQNKQQYPMFLMNRDGFALLAMGVTGDKALRFKMAYINAFNEMEKAFIFFLIDKKYIYRDQKGTLKPVAKYVGTYFELKEWVRGEKTGTQTLITAKGKEQFLELINSIKL